MFTMQYNDKSLSNNKSARVQDRTLVPNRMTLHKHMSRFIFLSPSFILGDVIRIQHL